VLQRIDGTEGYRVSVKALARMSYSNLQRHPDWPSRCLQEFCDSGVRYVRRYTEA
jgi:hypothetical protein